MREILERHAERLTSDERQAIWRKVSGARAGASPERRRWAALATAAAAVVLLAITLLQREPAVPRPSPGAHAPGVATKVGSPAPVRAPSAPEARRPLAPAPIARVARRAAAASGAAAAPEVARAQPAPAAASADQAANRGALTGRITDAHGQPLAYANVAVLGTRTGAATREDGTYRINGLPPATYSLRVNALGYRPEVLDSVKVEGEQTAMADIRMSETVVKQVEEVQVSAERGIVAKSSGTRQSISAERLRKIPVDNLSQAGSAKAGTVAQGNELHFRGGRTGEVKHQFDGVTGAPASPPVVPTTGGTRLPNDEAFDSMFFRNYGVNPFVATDEDPLSTFAVDVDAASYTLARRYIDLGHLPPADAVRVEEFVNFFPQGYPQFDNEDFRILVDGAPSPFGRGYHLLRIGIKGREIAERDRKPAQLTFVIDVSGSMSREDRLELVKRALRLLVDQLRADDRVGIVVFGTSGRVLLEPVALAEEDGRRRILDAIEQLQPEGSTNTEDGLRLGYQMARRGFRPDANNRIVLCSDGVANEGRTGPESILAAVRTGADHGIALTTIGFGMGNYNDVLMEQLADRGDGNHYYVDDLEEARRVFVGSLAGTLQTIARDAKVQVEFDSTRVLRYRLLGFENREVADRDFRNDKVDAGEIGAGHEVTALYEVKLAPRAARGTLATIRLRYARPEQGGTEAPQVREIDQPFDIGSLDRSFEDAAPRFRLDAAVAEFAEILRGSYWARDGKLVDVLPVARRAARDLRDDASSEFSRLVEKAAGLAGKSKPAEGGEER